MRYVLAFLLVLCLSVPVTSTVPPPVVGAMVFRDLAIGTVYMAAGIVRTAAHVAPYLIWAGIPGETAEIAKILCTHAPTDSATATTSAVMQNYEVGPTPLLGSEVLAVGLLNGRWPPAMVKTVIDSYYKHRKAETVTVGPMLGMPFSGKANGMSGGPILYHGKAVATISMFGDDRLWAVPLDHQLCPLR